MGLLWLSQPKRFPTPALDLYFSDIPYFQKKKIVCCIKLRETQEQPKYLISTSK